MAKYLQRRRRQRWRSPSASDALCVKCWLACPRLRSLQGEWHIKLILVWWGCGRAWLQPLCITCVEKVSELRCREIKKEICGIIIFFFARVIFIFALVFWFPEMFLSAFIVATARRPFISPRDKTSIFKSWRSLQEESMGRMSFSEVAISAWPSSVH